MTFLAVSSFLLSPGPTIPMTWDENAALKRAALLIIEMSKRRWGNRPKRDKNTPASGVA